MKNTPSIGAVLRAYNNIALKDQLARLAETNMVDRIVVVTNLREDKNGFTPKIVSEFIQNTPESKRPEISLIELDNYTWSNALNAGIGELVDGKAPVDRVWCLSNEVKFGGKEGIEALLQASSLTNASCGFSLYEDRSEEVYLLPRNTCSMWRADLLKQHHANIGHYFDPIMDTQGGMEDILTAFRLFSKLECVPIASATTAKISVPPPEKFAEKMRHELSALDFIKKQFSEKNIFDFYKAIEENSQRPIRPGILYEKALPLRYNR
ncbi:MAG: hypothetical protein PHX43_04070 [Alphaproteobacteria bacterium]|nr:hypothetical protein [Alphaproteobacteria bacterium]